MTENPLPSPETLRQLLDYDPKTGELFWRWRSVEWFATKRAYSTWNARYSGKPAFTAYRLGYKQGSVQNRKMSAHRVAFAIYYGRWPIGELDHINGIRYDNRITNLREVTRQENARNLSLRSDNKSGHIGVAQKIDGSWQAYITVDKKMIHLGFHKTKDEAIEARMKASKKFCFHENHGRPLS